MRNRKIIYIAVVGLILLGVYKNVLNKSVEKIEPSSRETLLTIATPIHSNFTQRVNWFGTVKRSSGVDIISLSDGLVQSVFVKSGEKIEVGTPILSMGNAITESNIKFLKEEVTLLKNRVTLAQMRLSQTESRFKNQLATQKDILSSQDNLYQISLEYKATQAQLETLKRKIVLLAQIGGMITMTPLLNGHFVKAGEKVGTIQTKKRLSIVAALFTDEQNIMGRSAVIRSGQDEKLKGVVTSVTPQKLSNGATEITISVDSGASLSPEESVRGTIEIAQRENVLAIIHTALVENEFGSYVFVKKDTTYLKREVKTGLKSDSLVEIISGVRDEDSIVSKGSYELFYRDFSKTFKVVD